MEGKTDSDEIIIGLDSNLHQKIIIAGPTNPLCSQRVKAIVPLRFVEEPLALECEWEDCSFKTKYMQEFMNHVSSHVPSVEVVMKTDLAAFDVFLICKWDACPWKTAKTSEDLQRHLYLHAYHTKLKCIGRNTIDRASLNPCRADSSNRNILPDLSENLLCAWGECSEQFTNIQTYYNHISVHIDDQPRGKTVPGGIKCLWSGCVNIFPNATKLRDHMRSHTQEKLTACPNCGGLFSNRTRLFDHCRRQVLLEELSYACDVCMKCFSTARLLRDHIRSHVNTYRCPECEMSCSSPSGINAHIRYKHSHDKPYSCELCSYSAKSAADLQKHLKVHNQPIFKCEEGDCEFESKSMAALRIHWSKHHTENGGTANLYACHVCDKRFRKGFYLTKHLIAAHKLQWPSGHSRFRYKIGTDGYFRLLTVRYESVEEPQ